MAVIGLLGEKLPKCTYQTIADKYITGGFMLLALAGFEHAYVFAMQRNDGRPFTFADHWICGLVASPRSAAV